MVQRLLVFSHRFQRGASQRADSRNAIISLIQLLAEESVPSSFGDLRVYYTCPYKSRSRSEDKINSPTPKQVFSSSSSNIPSQLPRTLNIVPYTNLPRTCLGIFLIYEQKC